MADVVKLHLPPVSRRDTQGRTFIGRRLGNIVKHPRALSLRDQMNFVVDKINEGHTAAQIAHMINKTPEYTKDVPKLLWLSTPVFRLFEVGELSFRAAVRIASEPDGRQLELAMRAVRKEKERTPDW